MATPETVGQRFTKLITHLGISKNAFATSLDKTATVIQHLVDERNKPGFDLLCKVFEVYPNVSKDWLLQGTGPMLSDALASDTATQSVPAAAAPVEKAVPAAAPEVAVAPAAAATPVAPLPPEPAPAPASPASVVPLAADTPPPAPALPAMPPTAPDTSWQTALYTQQMAHQLALAELRNQHLQEQQRLMQQMMDLMQRQLQH